MPSALVTALTSPASQRGRGQRSAILSAIRADLAAISGSADCARACVSRPPPNARMREDAGMLGDLDRSVAAFLGGLLPEGTAVRFDPPAALRDEDVLLDAFLYDIREARSPVADGTLTRDDEGHVTGWQPPVRRYRVS